MRFTGAALTEVIVDVKTLLLALKNNLAEHEKLYNKLFARYQELGAEALRERLLLLMAATPFDEEAPNLVFSGLEPPDDHRQDYELAIEMLELHASSQHSPATIAVDSVQCRAFLHDDWPWQGEFWAKNCSMYGVRRQPRKKT